MPKDVNQPQERSSFVVDLRSIEDKLQGLIDNTEHYYGVVHESLPVIERNIELTDQETSMLINYFIDSDDLSPAEGQQEEPFLMAEALQQIQDKFQEISEFLLNQEEINQMLGHFLGKTQSHDSFENFLQRIQEVENTLSEVNDISLNAMIFSARLGDSGRGFGVISDHIHQASTFMDQEFSMVDEQLEALQQWQQGLVDNVEQIVSTQEKAVQDYIQQIDDTFSQVIQSIQAISKILRNIMQNVNEAVSPFQELMTFIQRQDIVRQNMENTIKCLSQVEEKYSKYHQLVQGEQTDSRDILDHIAFIERALGLLEQLMGRVSSELGESLDDISGTTDQLVQSLEEVKEDSRQLTSYLAGESMIRDGVEDLSMVDYTFSSMFAFMNEFLDLLKEIKTRAEYLTADKETFNSSITSLEQSMGKIYTRINLLKKVKTLARIELARMGQQDHAIGKKVESVVEEVSERIESNQEIFNNLKTSLNKDLSRFDQIIAGNQEQINRAVDEVDVSLEQVKATNDIIGQAVVALNKEIETLHQTVNQVYQRLKGVEELKEKCQEIYLELSDALARAQQEKEYTFEHYQVEDWEEKSEELVELFNLFTSYLERSTAKSYFGEQDLDEGSGEGELTLF